MSLPEQRANGRIPARAHTVRQTTTSHQPVQRQTREPDATGSGASVDARLARMLARQQQRTTSQYVWQQANQSSADTLDDEELGLDDDVALVRVTPKSALRYVDTRGNPVLQDGQRRYVMHQDKPPRRFHWLFFVSVGMLVTIGLGVGLSTFGNWWSNHQLDSQYGFPRTWQIDVNVGHEQGKSHFIFENRAGHVFFLEIPEGTDFKHAVIYPVTVLYGQDASQVPVTATFADVNHDGKLDIIIHIGSTDIVYINTGNGFKPEQ